MTDAREIIAQYLCDRDGQGWSGISPFERAAYRTVALGMIAALPAAGFRILGPDEVDAVTVERAAEICERPVIGFQDGAVEASRYYAATIRALSENEGEP